MDAEEAALFTKSVQQAVASHTGADLDRALDDLGWSEALEAAPAEAVGALFAAQGAAAATSSALHRVLATGLGLAQTTAPVLLPPLDSPAVPGRIVADRVHVHGLAIRLGPDGGTRVAEPLLVSVSDGVTTVVDHVLVPTSAGVVRVAVSDVSVREVRGLDPAFGLVEVTGDVPLVVGPAPSAWETSVALGRRALAAELVGTGRTMLELARVHALDREQFGRPISAFQAVRHRLADTLVALESADGLIAASWEDDSPVLAAMAKAVAGRAARTAARHCQQVLAGIGFTTEHRFHHYLRRALLLDQLLGSAKTLTRELGDDLLAARRLPALLPL